jgi:hypothetical protein
MVQALIASGGSIKDKYDLYWKLQLERFDTLSVAVDMPQRC